MTVEATNVHLATNYNFTTSKLYFTFNLPFSERNTKDETIRLVVQVDGKNATKPLELLYDDAVIWGEIEEGGNDTRKYVWQDQTWTCDSWNSYMTQKYNQNVEVSFYYTETNYCVKETTVCFMSGPVKNGVTNVNLPLDGWEVGAYTFDVLYPQTRNYEESSTTVDLAYKTWNIPSQITCLQADDNLNIMVYPTENATIEFDVKDISKYPKIINSGEIEIEISDELKETRIFTSDTSFEVGEVSDLNYVITTVSTDPENVLRGSVYVNTEAEQAIYHGDTTTLNEFDYFPTVADEEYYVRPTVVIMDDVPGITIGRNGVIYWEKVALMQSIIDTKLFCDISSDGEYLIGLINTSTENAVCSLHYLDDTTFEVITNNTIEEVTFTEKPSSYEFRCTPEGQISVIINHEHTIPLITGDSSYYLYFEATDTLGPVFIKSVNGGYGD